jgi:hypothetical protein
MGQSALHYWYTRFIKRYVIYAEFIEHFVIYIQFRKCYVMYSFIHFIHCFCQNVDVGHVSELYRYENMFLKYIFENTYSFSWMSEILNLLMNVQILRNHIYISVMVLKYWFLNTCYCTQNWDFLFSAYRHQNGFLCLSWMGSYIRWLAILLL